MSEYEIVCSHCLSNLNFPDSMLDTKVDCPTCGNSLELTCPPAILQKTEDQEPVESMETPSSPPPPAPVQEEPENAASANLSSLPERMKANKLIAGKNCVICGNEIDLGQDVYNCPDCFSSMHAECHAKRKGCGNPECPGYKKKLSIAGKKPSSSKPQDDRVPCRFCGEPIKRGAKICMACNELQREGDRKLFQKNNASTDEELSWGEIVFACLCGGIACIVGIVYICQGKKKGWKIIGISILASIVWSIIKGMIEALQK